MALQLVLHHILTKLYQRVKFKVILLIQVMAAQILPLVLLIFSVLAATVAEVEIDIDGDGLKDVKVNKNVGKQILLFSNHVFRNGIKKITENIDISQLDKIKVMMDNDKIVLKKLQAFRNIKKYDLGSECPNFEYKRHVDDIKDDKFLQDYDAHTSIRVMHGEYFPSPNGLRFIVTISKIDNAIVCHYEFSASQTLIFKTTSLGKGSIKSMEHM